MFGYLLYKLVCNFAGFLYPAYASFKAVKLNNTRIISSWLIYWIVMAFFSVGEGFADKLIFWFPFYYEIKIIFTLWLILPQTQGAALIYCNYVEPTLTRHEREIEATLGKVQEKALNTCTKWGKHGVVSLQKLAADGLIKGQQIMIGQSLNDSEKVESSPNKTASPINNIQILNSLLNPAAA